MGADMLASAVVIDLKTQPDWTQILPAIEALGDDALDDYADYSGDYDRDDDCNLTPSARADIKKEVLEAFIALRDIVDNSGLASGRRDVVEFWVRGARVIASGGMSWGDSPTDSFDVFNTVLWFPTVLTAIGFEVQTAQSNAATTQ